MCRFIFLYVAEVVLVAIFFLLLAGEFIFLLKILEIKILHINFF